MTFNKYSDLIFFLRKKWLPLGVKKVDINYHETHFYYKGFINTLAQSLSPDICMITKPDAEQWGVDMEAIGMEWDNEYFSITASPVDERVFLIIVIEKAGKIEHLNKFLNVFLAQQKDKNWRSC
nr:hypothetical protein [Providencia alcalifaciens]